MSQLRLLTPGVAAAVLLFVPIACQNSDGPRVVVRGRLLNNGQPVQIDASKLPPGDPGIQITFLPLQEGMLEEPAAYDPATSTFEVLGPAGNGIRPGQYKIAVNAGAFGTKDLFGGRFDRDNTPIIRDVQGSGTVTLDIDLAKPNG